MSITREQAAKVPDVYRTFLEALWPVLNTSPPGPQMWISAIPFSRVYRALADEYGYSVVQVEQVADKLAAAGLINQDEHRFFRPTDRGAELMRLWAEEQSFVPELPSL